MTRFNRWESPKFLAGESYGTTRAAGLAGYLQDHHGIDLNGIILISSVLNFETIRFDDGQRSALHPVPARPTRRRPGITRSCPPTCRPTCPRRWPRCEKFASGEYTAALMKGDALPDDERQEIASKLARYTGLSEDYRRPQQSAHRASRASARSCCATSSKRSGRYDSRFTGHGPGRRRRDRRTTIPATPPCRAPFTAAFNQYVRDELKYENDLTYEILTGKVQPWNYGDAQQPLSERGPDAAAGA